MQAGNHRDPLESTMLQTQGLSRSDPTTLLLVQSAQQLFRMLTSQTKGRRPRDREDRANILRSSRLARPFAIRKLARGVRSMLFYAIATVAPIENVLR